MPLFDAVVGTHLSLQGQDTRGQVRFEGRYNITVPELLKESVKNEGGERHEKGYMLPHLQPPRHADLPAHSRPQLDRFLGAMMSGVAAVAQDLKCLRRDEKAG